MIDILIIVIIAFISIAFSGRDTTPELLTGILYNSEFKEDESVKSESYNNEVSEDSGNEYEELVEDEVPTEAPRVSEVPPKPIINAKEINKTHKKPSKQKLEDKMDYLDTTDLSDDYSMEDISSESKSLIKEILSRE